MMKKRILCGLFLAYAVMCLSVFAQELPTTPMTEPANVRQTRSTTAEKNPNENPGHVIESWALSLQILDFSNDGTTLTIKMKNISQKKIASARIRANRGSYMLPMFTVEPGKEREYSTGIGGYMDEQGFIVEAILFEDGEGEGDAERLEGLKMVFRASRQELEKISGFIDEISSQKFDSGAKILKSFEAKLKTLPDEFVDFKKTGMGGATLFSGKLNFLWRIEEMRMKPNHTEVKWVLGELGKIKTEIKNTISVYPKVAD